VTRTIPLALVVLVVSFVSGCGGSPAAPGATPPVATPPSGSVFADLSGAWIGTGTDPQGPETLKWTLTQAGASLSGTARLDPADATDGTCGSCHKQKTGTVSGSMEGSVLKLTLDFPAGGNDLTPLCGITITATTSDVATGRIAAAYTGTTTCEGPIAGGSLVMTRGNGIGTRRAP
jgi:hypothetical protein